MSEFDFQRALVRVLTDAALRESIYAGDYQPLVELGIPLTQAQRLTLIDRERMEMFADTIVENRVYYATELLPFTTQFLGEQLEPMILECDREMPADYSKIQDQALAFARFLKKRFGLQPPTPPFLEDVLTYEINSLELFAGYDRQEFEVSQQDQILLQQLLAHDELARIIPVPRPNNRIIKLNYDVPSILEEIVNGHIPETADKQDLHLLLRMIPPGTLEQDKINVPTSTLINACDGEANLSEIIEQLASHFKMAAPMRFPDFKRKCLELCQSLVERHVIILMPLQT